MSCRLYDAQLPRLAKLEKRSGNYRFDIDRDPEWDRVGEAGIYLPPGLLRDCGINVDAIGVHLPEFDWIVAASICRVFVLLEESILEFCDRESTGLLPSLSVDNLVDEERKHIELFRRFEKELLCRHDAPTFERVYAKMGEKLRDRHMARLYAIGDAAERHYVFWVNTLFFEELTVYFDECLRGHAGAVQPAWLSVHGLHRREELQHVATDLAYLQALWLPDERRMELSRWVVAALFQDFHETMGLTAGLRRMDELGVSNACPLGLVSQRPFFRENLRSRHFRGTLASLPYLARLLGP